MPQQTIAELVLENARDYAVITMDLGGLVTSWSRGAEEILGWSSDEIIGKSGEIIFTPEDRADRAPEREFIQARTLGRGVDERWHVRRDESRFWASGETLPLLTEGALSGYLKILRDRTAERMAKLQIEHERDRLHQMFQQAPGFFTMLRGPEHRFEIVNPQYLKLVAHRDIVGKTVREALPELEGQGFYELLDDVFTSGKTFVGSALPIDLQPSPGSPSERRHLDFVYQPVRDNHGAITGIFVQGTDVTDRQRTEELQKTLNAEISHRMKNQMAMMAGIVRQSMREETSVKVARDAILDRISVLSRANDLLLTGSGTRAAVRSVIEESIEFGDDREEGRFALQGPDLLVGSRAALSLAMMIHELTTNAVKYGALSSDIGQVAVEWRTEHENGEDIFVLNWIESGGPPAVAPARRGFGSRLLQGGISGATSTVSMDYEPTGFRCTLRASLNGMHEED